MEKENILGRMIDRSVDAVFGLRKTTILLLLIFIFGLFLRIIAAINLSVFADDMHFVTHAFNFFSSGRLVTYDQSSGLWFAFTSVIYNLFGATQISSRLAAIIFGSLSIFAIYLLSREFFNEKISLLASFFLAIAPIHIKNTVAEMDVMAMFFVLLGMFFFVKSTKTPKKTLFLLSGIFFGLAVYTKVYPLLFIPSMLIYFIYYNRKEKRKLLSKVNIKGILIFMGIILIFSTPALAHNYLLYQDKGFLDLQFTRTLGLGKDISAQYYSWDVQFDRENSWIGLFLGDANYGGGGKPLLLAAIDFIRGGDPIFFYLGLAGLALLLFKRSFKKEFIVFFTISILFVLPFLASIILLPKHFLFLEILLIPPAAVLINFVSKKGSNFLGKKSGKIILTIVLISSLIFLGTANTNTANHMYGESHVNQIITFKDNSIPKDSLLIVDSRFYRGRVHWMSQGRPYLEGTEFIGLLNRQNELPGDSTLNEVYFIECVIDDCGWGGIDKQPEFNASMESLTNFFKDNGRLVKEIKEPDRDKSYFPLISKNNEILVARIYDVQIPLKSSIISIANQPKNWFLYPIGYEPIESNFDYYEVSDPINNLVNSFAHLIRIFALILAFISPIYVIYLITIKR